MKTDKLADALAAGQLWRAKEILGGRVGSGRFDAALYEQFGVVLLKMGDDLQAGRFLFLSGVRRPEYQAAIDVFVRRTSRSRNAMLAHFPAAARRSTWAQLPQQVQDDLVAAGIPYRGPDEPIWALSRHPSAGPGLKGCILGLLAVVGIGLLLSIIIVYGGF